MTSLPTTTTDPPVTRSWRRRLRIGWTVFFAVLTVALCVLWVRSYWRTDTVVGPLWHSQSFNIVSTQGKLGLAMFVAHSPIQYFEASTGVYREGILIFAHSRYCNQLGFRYFVDESHVYVVAPHWFIIPIPIALSALPWLPRWSTRFSLRTMLIATTLIAAAMGAMVWKVGRMP